jgi:hypothetical protein
MSIPRSAVIHAGSRPRRALVSGAVLAALTAATAQAGRYPASSSQAFSYANGTVAGSGAWNDGTSLSSTLIGDPPLPVASVQGNALRLAGDGQTNTAAAFKIPDLDVGQDIGAVTISFSLKAFASGTAGQGISVNFGGIPETNGDGELGWALPGGLTVGFETFGNQPVGSIAGAIVVYANNALVARYPQTFINDTAFRAVVVRYDAQGLDVRYNNADVAVNLPLPGFAPSIGNRVAFSARTGAAASQEIAIDSLSVLTTPTTAVATGGPVISEFVAFNSGSYEDEDLETPDWIEIMNGSGTPVAMAGWLLTTDPTHQDTWALPSVSVPANGYRIVFASGKNRAPTTATGQLHTHFTLQRETGYLALLRPDKSVASEFTYGPQYADIPYGEIGSARVRGYLETPTPGVKNVSLVGGGPPAEDVVFSRPGGLIAQGETITLAITPPAQPGAVIRYALGQAVPTETSPVYTEPFSITTTTTIRARVFAAGQLPGPVSSRTFLRYDATLANYNGSGQVFSSNLPVIVFDSHGVNVDATTDPNSARPYRPTYAVVIPPDPATGRARLNGPADYQGRGGTHVRGESSSSFGQKAYAWETWDNRDQDKDESFLGLPAESDWALIAPWSEKTMLRNYLVFSGFNDMRGDWVAPRTRFVEVFFNQEAGQPLSYADYRGCYLLVERIKRATNRIDIADTNPLVTDPALLTGGYIFKTDKINPGTTQWTTSRGVSIQSSDPGVFSAAQRAYLQKYLNDYEAVLHGTSFTNPQTGYAAWIDVPSFIDSQWAVEISKQIDGYVFSTYYHKDRGGKVRAGPLWDFNISMGNADYAEGEFYDGWNYAPAPRTAPLAGGLWYTRLHADPNYRVRTFDRYWELRAGAWNTQSLMARIDAAVAQLTDGDPTPVTNTTANSVQTPVARHYRKHKILGTRQWPNPAVSTTLTTYQAEIAFLKKWMTDRLAWMDNQFTVGTAAMRPPVLTSVPEGQGAARISLAPFAGTSAGVHYPAGTLYYTTDGTDPRPLHYALPTTQNITLLPEYGTGSWFIPTATNGGDSLAPESWTGLADPPNAGAWASGTLGIGFDTQPSSSSNPTMYHVGGAHVGDTAWTGGPSNVQAAMLNQTAAAFVRVPFSLTADQRARMATLTLRLRYDDGFIAFINGVEVHRQHVTANTPAAWNAAANATPSTHTETAATTLASFNVSQAIQHLREGPNMLALVALNKTAADSDFLVSPSLTAALGVRPAAAQPAITAPVYGAPLVVSTTTTVKARLFWPETGMWSPLANSTFAPSAVPATRENFVISEIHYDPAAPTTAEIAAGGSAASDFEYIEFLNTSSSDTVDLTGVRLTGAVQEFDFTLAEPSARLLPPGARVIVCANAAAFAARYGPIAGLRLAGSFAGNLNNAGETITLLDKNGAVLWSFAYDNNPPWPQVGDGASILLNNPSSKPAPDPALGSNWRASPAIGGAPGFPDSVPLALAPVADDDGDGQENLLEYILGSNPSEAASVASLAARLVPGATPETSVVHFEFPRNLTADGYLLTIETSTDLLTWRTDSTGLTFVGARRDGTGRQIETWSAPAPAAAAGVPLFFRLSAQTR